MMDRVHELMKLYYKNGHRHRLGHHFPGIFRTDIIYEIIFFNRKKKPLPVLQIKKHKI